MSASVGAARAGLRSEWVGKGVALMYLGRAGFVLREDRTWRPPERLLVVRRGRRCGPTLSGHERRAIEYLVVEFGFGGLLTDRQHEQRGGQGGGGGRGKKQPGHPGSAVCED